MLNRNHLNDLLVGNGYLKPWSGGDSEVKEYRKFLIKDEDRMEMIDFAIQHGEELLDIGVYDEFSGRDLIGLFQWSVITNLDPQRLPVFGNFNKDFLDDYRNSFWKV